MITTTGLSRGNRNKRGFSLAEILVALTILSLVMGALVQSMLLITKANASLGNYVIMNKESRVGLEIFGRDMRSTTNVIVAEPTRMEIRIETLAGFDAITYEIKTVPNPEKGTETVQGLVRTDINGNTKTLLYYITDLEFQYFDLRNNETNNGISVKKVQLDAEMVRNVLNLKNTNHVLSARFTMRNRKVST